MPGTVLWTLVGAIISIITTLFIDYLRKPKLDLTIAPPSDRQYSNRPASAVRFLGVMVRNKPLPKYLQLLSRNVAQYCHGDISFHHLDGQNIFGRTMEGRWSSSPEPAYLQLKFNENIIQISDPSKITTLIDIPPGEEKWIDIAAKFDDENDCFGWNNQSYFSEPLWRNSDWKLERGRYLVSVKIISAGEVSSKMFRLINDVSRNSFRLEPSQSNDMIT